MSMINTNVMSLNAQRNLATNSASLGTTIQRLSSGLRINSAKDDAAGLAISERFTTQIRGLNQAARNANDGISLAQTAEGALGEIGNNLQRIRELAVQSRNATNSVDDRAALQKEVTQLKAEIDRVAEQTSFNGTKLLDGSFTNQSFQVGANQGQTIDVSAIADANIDALGSWTSKSTTVSAQAASYTSGQLSSLDFSQSAQAFSGGQVTSAFTAGDFSTTSANFTVGTTAVEITGDYSGATDATGFATELAGKLGSGYAVTSSGMNVTIQSTASDSAVNITGSDGALANSSGTAGTAARASSNVSFTVGGSKNVSLSANYTGNQAGMIADIAADLGSDYVVTAEGASGFKITSATAGAALQADISNIGASSVSGVGGGASVTGTDQVVTTGTARTGFEDLDISTVDGADNAILAMDAALTSVNSARADLGAVQNRFQSVVSNLTTTSENLTASRSRIRDADYAKETAELSRTQILSQAGTAMLAQANQSGQSVLSLLR